MDKKLLKRIRILKRYLILSLILFFIPLFLIGINNVYAVDAPFDGDYGGDGSVTADERDDGSITADERADGSLEGGFKNPLGEIDTIYVLVYKLFDIIIQLGFILVIFAIIYSGFLFVKASGNPDKLTDAKRVFMWTIIGGVILLGSQAISGIVCETVAEVSNSETLQQQCNKVPW